MRIITNYWPDPRFAHADSWDDLSGCTASSSQTLNVSANIFPTLTLKSSKDGANWASKIIDVPEGAKLVIACASDGIVTSNNFSVDIWSHDSSKRFVNVGLDGGVSDEFVAPSRILVCFRAPDTAGKAKTVSRVFIGTKADYQALLNLVPSGFLAGDLMPKD